MNRMLITAYRAGYVLTLMVSFLALAAAVLGAVAGIGYLVTWALA